MESQMKGRAKRPLTKLATGAACACALTFSPMAAVAALAFSPADTDPGMIDVGVHHIHRDPRGVAPLAGLVLGLIGAGEAAEQYPYYYIPPYWRYDYHGKPYVGSYYYPVP